MNFLDPLMSLFAKKQCVREDLIVENRMALNLLTECIDSIDVEESNVIVFEHSGVRHHENVTYSLRNRLS